VSSCGFDGDAVAECGELGEMVAQLTFGVQTADVVVAAEVVETGSRVGQQAPYHDQDGAGHRHQGFELSTPRNEAPIACAEESVGARGHGGRTVIGSPTFDCGSD
jgi:hypothetical protein